MELGMMTYVCDPGTPKAEVDRRTEFNTSLGYTVKTYLKQKQKKKYVVHRQKYLNSDALQNNNNNKKQTKNTPKTI